MECTIYKTVDIVSKRWSLLILLELYKSGKRYNELKTRVRGITPKMLSMRLRELESWGLINKRVEKSIPVECHYGLTRSGREFFSIIKELKKWSLKWKVKNKACSGLLCRDCRI